MARTFKRLLLLVAIGALTIAVGAMLRRRRNESMPGAGSPQWPPSAPTSTPTPTAEPAPDWVASVDGECPAGYPVKANDNSHIYHVTGGRFYDRTVAERCYATAATAERDGYRPAKT